MHSAMTLTAPARRRQASERAPSGTRLRAPVGQGGVRLGRAAHVQVASRRRHDGGEQVRPARGRGGRGRHGAASAVTATSASSAREARPLSMADAASARPSRSDAASAADEKRGTGVQHHDVTCRPGGAGHDRADHARVVGGVPAPQIAGAAFATPTSAGCT